MNLRASILSLFVFGLAFGCDRSPSAPPPPATGPAASAQTLLDEFNRLIMQPIPDWKGLAALTVADSADEQRLLDLMKRYANTAEIWHLAHEKIGPGKYVTFGRSPWLSAEVKAPATFRSQTEEEALIAMRVADTNHDGHFRRIDGAWRIDASTFNNSHAAESFDDFCKLIELNIRPFEAIATELKEELRQGRIRSYDQLNEECSRLKGDK